MSKKTKNDLDKSDSKNDSIIIDNSIEEKQTSNEIVTCETCTVKNKKLNAVKRICSIKGVVKFSTACEQYQK